MSSTGLYTLFSWSPTPRRKSRPWRAAAAAAAAAGVRGGAGLDSHATPELRPGAGRRLGAPGPSARGGGGRRGGASAPNEI